LIHPGKVVWVITFSSSVQVSATEIGVVKIVYFRKGFLSSFLFLYKLSAILDFGFKEFCPLIDRAQRFHQSEIRNLKSQIITRPFLSETETKTKGG
jgi:hypothetical protein